MKRTLLLLLCLCGLFLPGKNSAQNTVITGQVLNEQNKPLANAIVALLKQKDTSLVKVMFTDNAGNYRFENMDGNKFILDVTMQGHKMQSRRFEVEDSEQKELNSVVLLTLKKGIAADAGPLLIAFDNKVVIDLEGNGAKVNGNAWDVLKTAPGISENEDGFISFKGKTSVVIEIDGKQNDLSRQGLKNKIKQIPATEISGIELFNETKNSNGKPVINIVTVEGAKEGFYGNVSTGFDFGKTTKTEDGFEFNYRTGNMNFFGSYDFLKQPSLENSIMTTSFLSDGTTINYLDSDLVTKKPIEHDAMAGFDYTGKKGLSFGVDVTAEQIREKGTENDVNQYSFQEPDTTLFFNKSYTTENNDAIKMMDFSISQRVRPIGAKFSFDGKIGKDISNWNEAFPTTEDVAGTHSQTVETFRRYIGGTNYSVEKGDFKYVQRFNDKFMTVAGVKSSLTTSASQFSVEKLDQGNWMNEGIQNETFGFKQQVNEAYLISRLDLGKFSIITALEAQQAISSGLSQTTESGKQKSGVQFIPSMIVDQNLNARNTIEYSFTQTMSRPSFRDLDPTAHYNNSYSYTIGNPDLRPEITNNAKIEYKFAQLFGLNAGMDLTQNGIERVSYIDDNGTLFYTKENLSKSRKTSFGVTGLLPIGNNILFQNQLTVNFSNFQSEIYGMSINSNSHSFSGSSELQIELPFHFVIDVNGQYVSATSNGLMETDAMGMLNASVSKTMLKDNLKIEVGANDILNTGSVSAKFLTQDGMVSYHSNATTQSVTVKAGYTFGNTKSKREE